MQQSFFWYDLETWGIIPSVDRISQFAGIRTDLELNIIGEPQNFYCQLSPDYLPNPEAACVTGLTPQYVNQYGEAEASFIMRVLGQLSQPGTCSVGYNSLRFDDEVIRHTLFRNLHDPYAREYQHGNSRWDIIDVLRACYALRPEGIEWIIDDEGKPSFKLEQLSVANNIEHQQAHDAMSDVYATIGLAKKIKTHQPKLFDYALSLRNKQTVKNLINVYEMTPLVHISSMFGATRHCLSLIAPISYHPTNKNTVIAVDLFHDPSVLLTLSPEEIKHYLYLPTSERQANDPVIPIKNIHLNRCPFVATQKVLSPQRAQELGVDVAQYLAHWQQLKQSPQLKETLAQVFNTPFDHDNIEVEQSLYSGGFLSDRDRQLCTQVHTLPPEQLAHHIFDFNDPRLQELLFRFRARNYPQTLDISESQRWQQFIYDRLIQGQNNQLLTIAQFNHQLELLAQEVTTTQGNDQKINLLKALYEYVQRLV